MELCVKAVLFRATVCFPVAPEIVAPTAVVGGFPVFKGLQLRFNFFI